ncbi:MAG: GGDEF domain-containing protein [Vicinamibacteria bacterium]
MDLTAKGSREPSSLAADGTADDATWRLRDIWREGHAPRDRFFDDAAASGELLVARVRLFIVTLLTLILVLPGWDSSVQWVALGTGAVSLVWAIGILALVRVYYRPWLAFVSAAMDITMVSSGLLGLMLAGRPDAAVNSRVLFEAYFLALGYSALRYDWRVCATSGLLAAAQYGALMAYAQAHWQLEDLGRAPDGVFSWNVQIARIVMILGASVLSATLVLRGQRLRHTSALDRLTGLHNRGAFDERLAQEASRARRSGRPWTLALFDLDHFKRYNDTHGHAGGDQALRALARVLRAAVRREDLVARYGGEEFALVLPETPCASALERLEAIRLAVAGLLLPEAKGAEIPARITVSIGVAGWPADGVDTREVIARADARLYQAKALGRNRLVGPAGAGV